MAVTLPALLSACTQGACSRRLSVTCWEAGEKRCSEPEEVERAMVASEGSAALEGGMYLAVAMEEMEEGRGWSWGQTVERGGNKWAEAASKVRGGQRHSRRESNEQTSTSGEEATPR